MDRETETVINRLMSDLKAAQDLSAYLAANNKKLRDALQRIADGDVDRESAVKFRTDGKYSKNDKCKHGLFMYEECGQCLSDFARAALKEGK